MQKTAPTTGKIMVAAGFALSCFALLLFLWVTFGGSIPFKPASYQFTADFAEAITLQKEADVRVGGVSVGKVKALELPPDGNATRVTIEIKPQYAPISSDAHAILRQKTLLGETYIELTTGSQVDPNGDQGGQTAQASSIDVGQISGEDAPHPIEEDGHLEATQVVEQTQIDEIFKALDPETRQAFQSWMANSAIGINGRGLDLNDAFGNIGPFSQDANDVLGTLRSQERALRTLVRQTGTVFEALTAREQDLAGSVVGSNRTFRALASRDQALAETFQILPTFENESSLTLDRLEQFSHNADPLFRDLKPVARDLSPTLRDLRRLAPHLLRLFRNLNPLIKVSRTGLPALSSILDELSPLFTSLDPFLANLNPVVRYLDYNSATLADFLAGPPAGLSGVLPEVPGQPSPRHVLRQLSFETSESVAVYPQRLNTNRGNGYVQPFAIGNPFSVSNDEVFPSFDCLNTGATGGLGSGQVTDDSTPHTSDGAPPSDASPSQPDQFAPCTLAPNFPGIYGGGRIPEISIDP